MISQQQASTIVSLQAINADYTSGAQSLKSLKNYFVDCVFAGDTISGTLSMEYSMDGSTFKAISGTSQTKSTTGTAGYNLSDQNYPYFRVKWVNVASSSNATLTITSYVK